MDTHYYFLDFEASSLGFDSYPIEVAWGSLETKIQNYLISPANIPYWDDWSPAAQKIHGIAKKTLIKKGDAPHVVAQAIVKSLEGKTVYTDNPDFDGMWMKALFDATQLSYPDINILHLDSLLIETVCPDIGNRVEHLKQIIKIKMAARHKIKTHHRADHDVRYLIETFKMAKAFKALH